MRDVGMNELETAAALQSALTLYGVVSEDRPGRRMWTAAPRPRAWQRGWGRSGSSRRAAWRTAPQGTPRWASGCGRGSWSSRTPGACRTVFELSGSGCYLETIEPGVLKKIINCNRLHHY